MKLVIFGAGDFGRQALQYFGKDEIAFFVDNNDSKAGSMVEGVRVHGFKVILDKLPNYRIIVAVSHKYLKEVEAQLENYGLTYTTFQEIKMINVKKKILNRPDYLGIYSRAIDWIKTNHLQGNGIVTTTKMLKGYPEVTGYYIPTLLQWGYRDLAASFGKWLIDIQKADGSWYDAENREPYIFDSGQILKGLVAIKKAIVETKFSFAYSEVELDESIKKGIEWIFSYMKSDGQLETPSDTAWGEKRVCSEVVHLYCLQPIMEAARIYNRPDYKNKVQLVLAYYKKKYMDIILHFGLLSHFYSYVIEALVDLGEKDLAREAMKTPEKLMDTIGFVPGYRDVHWCCSTGLFQQAIIWYKLGDREHGDKAFEYACKLQNPSGGWFGSYLNPEYRDEENDYFPGDEISWAVKYFLDALYYKNQADFNAQAEAFVQEYPKTDGRYQMVYDKIAQEIGNKTGAAVLDVGCGKGAYLHNLLKTLPNIHYVAVDISTKVMSFIRDTDIEKKAGSLTAIPFADNMFDFTYTTEALEHAVDISSAVRELCRVTKPGGKVLILDKNLAQLGAMEICDWEQWFDIDDLKQEMEKYCKEVQIDTDISYDDHAADGLFCAWTGTVL